MSVQFPSVGALSCVSFTSMQARASRDRSPKDHPAKNPRFRRTDFSGPFTVHLQSTKQQQHHQARSIPLHERLQSPQVHFCQGISVGDGEQANLLKEPTKKCLRVHRPAPNPQPVVLKTHTEVVVSIANSTEQLTVLRGTPLVRTNSHKRSSPKVFVTHAPEVLHRKKRPVGKLCHTKESIQRTYFGVV